MSNKFLFLSHILKYFCLTTIVLSIIFYYSNNKNSFTKEIVFAESKSVIFTNASSNFNETKVIILMVENRDIYVKDGSRSYYHYTSSINAKYAKEHGYEYIWYRPSCETALNCDFDEGARHRAPSWGKVKAIKDILSNFKSRRRVIILFIDSDAYISDHSLVVNKMSAPIAIWEDEKRGKPCSGTFLVTNTDSSVYKIINQWWSHKSYKYDLKRQWEQEVLKGLISKYKDKVIMLPSLGWKYGTYVASQITDPYWDNGVHIASRSLRYMKYFTFIKHMWGGIAGRNISYIMKESARLNATLLHSTDFHICHDYNSSLFNCLN